MLLNSQEVADGVREAWPGAQVEVAPLSLDPAHYLPRAPLRAPVAGLIGFGWWPPTANAVERLLRRVWPIVLRSRPDARLVLAGAGMEPAEFAHLPHPAGVEWRGRVPSATDLLRELGVLLYPLTRGSGMKVKVLEALALGIPVVTTPSGAEGIAPGSGVTIERDDEALATATVKLLEDPEARSAAGAEAHAAFVRAHTPDVAAKPVLDLYERMLG